MAPPQTGFEVTGTRWTTLEEETAFLQTLDAETSATVTVAGYSRENRPIYRTDLGAGTDQTLLITSLIHGDEAASREALLPFLRDLAYSTDPAVVAYLSTHRIVALTPCNPDGFLRGTRRNAVNANINRDFYLLIEPETQAIMQTVAAVRPDMILDIHEFLGNEASADWSGRAGGNPVTHPAVQAMEQACYDAGDAVINSLGLVSSAYPYYLTMRTGMSTVAGPNHSVGVLSETSMGHPMGHRITLQRQILDVFRDWHSANAEECKAAVAQSRADAAAGRVAFPLYTNMYLGEDHEPEHLHVHGYQIEPGTPTMPALHKEVFGVVVQPGGFVPMAQEAQWVVPTLCDPDSPDRQVTARRVGLPVSGRLVDIRFGAYGKSRELTAMRFRAGGTTRRVDLPGR